MRTQAKGKAELEDEWIAKRVIICPRRPVHCSLLPLLKDKHFLRLSPFGLDSICPSLHPYPHSTTGTVPSQLSSKTPTMMLSASRASRSALRTANCLSHTSQASRRQFSATAVASALSPHRRPSQKAGTLDTSKRGQSTATASSPYGSLHPRSSRCR